MNSQCPILLVEDSPEDTEAILRAFQRIGLDHPVVHCGSGDDALDFLHLRGKYADPARAPRPCLILLDLNLPGTDGRDVLADVKHDEQLKTIPVVVLTTSTDERDVESCRQMGANSYINKPVDFSEFLGSVQHIKDFWFGTALLTQGDAENDRVHPISELQRDS